MDADIQFGDVEEERPRSMRRPDENRHFAVVPCGEPRADDLAIYVDLDAMLDMETHAQSNTNVELGGVLLGGQHIDGEGQPFVVVSDCLRADHYEATKGSFKFTHDTWSDLTRKIEEFPEDLRMVGWYHTHPDWGVFLSGMDNFICENFFNKPLDLALVIDPCRGDRGWFQWSRARRRDPQRTGGFYLISSRFREEELQHWACVWEGSADMPIATRSGNSTSGGYGAPVVNVVQDRSSQWIQVAVLGSLALQTVLVGVLALAVLASGRIGSSDSEAADKLRIDQIKLQASRETLDRIARGITEHDSFVSSLEKSESAKKMLETSLESVAMQNTVHQNALKDAEKALGDEQKRSKSLADSRDVLRRELETSQKRVRALSKEPHSEETETASQWSWKSPWLWAVAAVGIGLAILGAVMMRSPKPMVDEIAPSNFRDSGSHEALGSKDRQSPTNTPK